ncbi:RNA-protein complex protein Nop10 [Candidatus Bathyarchaeota archaeon]|nr:RNA-protein complex protein Nop10 [Candidatus Bathyarchaeota archaeon]
MVWLLRKCEKCIRYTLNTEECPHCGGKVHIPHPAKFSPNDKYAKYRIALKRKDHTHENNDQRYIQDKSQEPCPH